MSREDGGVFAKLIGWLLLLAVAASAGLFVYVRTQAPLAIGTPTVRTEGLGRDLQALPLRADGHIWVATFVRNTGRLPIALQGISIEPGTAGDPYVATELLLGDGETADPAAAAPLTPVTLAPDQSVGVVVVFSANTAMRCGPLPVHASSADGSTLVDRFAIRATVYGIERTQTVVAASPFAVVAPVSRGACESVVS